MKQLKSYMFSITVVALAMAPGSSRAQTVAPSTTDLNQIVHRISADPATHEAFLAGVRTYLGVTDPNGSTQERRHAASTVPTATRANPDFRAGYDVARRLDRGEAVGPGEAGWLSVAVFAAGGMATVARDGSLLRGTAPSLLSGPTAAFGNPAGETNAPGTPTGSETGTPAPTGNESTGPGQNNEEPGQGPATIPTTGTPNTGRVGGVLTPTANPEQHDGGHGGGGNGGGGGSGGNPGGGSPGGGSPGGGSPGGGSPGGGSPGGGSPGGGQSGGGGGGQPQQQQPDPYQQQQQAAQQQLENALRQAQYAYQQAMRERDLAIQEAQRQRAEAERARAEADAWRRQAQAAQQQQQPQQSPGGGGGGAPPSAQPATQPDNTQQPANGTPATTDPEKKKGEAAASETPESTEEKPKGETATTEEKPKGETPTTEEKPKEEETDTDEVPGDLNGILANLSKDIGELDGMEDALHKKEKESVQRLLAGLTKQAEQLEEQANGTRAAADGACALYQQMKGQTNNYRLPGYLEQLEKMCKELKTGADQDQARATAARRALDLSRGFFDKIMRDYPDELGDALRIFACAMAGGNCLDEWMKKHGHRLGLPRPDAPVTQTPPARVNEPAAAPVAVVAPAPKAVPVKPPSPPETQSPPTSPPPVSSELPTIDVPATGTPAQQPTIQVPQVVGETPKP